MIHLCRTLLWIFVGCIPLVSGDGTAAAGDVSALADVSRSFLPTASVAAIGNIPPHAGGRLNLTDPDPVSEAYIPPDASPAPPPSEPFYTDTDNSSSTVLATPVTTAVATPPSIPGPAASVTASIAAPPNFSGIVATPPPIGSHPTILSGPSIAVGPPGFKTVSNPSAPLATPPGLPLPTSIVRPPESLVSAGSGPHLATNPSSFSSLPSSFSNGTVKWSNHSTSFPTKTLSLNSPIDNHPITVTPPSLPVSSVNYANCSTLSSGQAVTVWQIFPNTTTITLTITGNKTTTYSSTSEFTPPVYCPDTAAGPLSSVTTDQGGLSSSTNPIPAPSAPYLVPSRSTITFQTTSKNPPVVTTSILYPSYPDGSSAKQSVTSTDTYTDTYQWGPATFPGFPSSISAIPITTILNEDLSSNTPITYVLDDGVTVMVGTNVAVIGGQTYTIGPSTETITQGPDTFTIGPSSILGPMLVAYVPTAGGITAEAQTTINGVPIDVGPTKVVLGGTTFAIGAGAPDQTAYYNGKTITLGAAGVIMDQTTLAPPSPLPTNNVIIGGEVFSAIGSSIAVIGGSTITYGSGIPVTTDVVNGDTITIGPSGVSFDGTTLGGPDHATGTQLGIVGGVSVTEVGSTLAVVDGVTLTVGPNATPTTTVINGHTVTIASSGLGVNGATLSFPFNPTTQAVTAGGITFSEIGSSLVVIGGTTFTFGAGATPTTDVYDGQTITIGPHGVGFKTTTFTGATATSTHKKKNAAAGLRARKLYGVLGTCIVFGVLYLL
ncbi:hypothetical protein L207DRAFT_520113 [Hyaloscypha variabilis F]|uniref:Uncharacterized protein n=1 Tax=Hyaloscypha variabilis (strain UAMH 11265 / GT02V1 / F) TaxID=1149755 RepID=A0A2J6QWH3_HYAVF|nr:hypothetical protein L207DRAFT_520113 [Hyaloscypha variabilis F]